MEKTTLLRNYENLIKAIMALTLIVLAAGMGSRFGGLKQLSPVNSYDETIIDYSVYDAKRAGFTKVVFVIREELDEAFKSQITYKYKNQIETAFVYQDTATLPVPASHYPDRTKPWGTGHAIWSCRKVVSNNFAVINADDFYGFESFQILANFLKKIPPTQLDTQAMVGFELKNTLSSNGSVSRGICIQDKNGVLSSITERTNIERIDKRIVYREDSNLIELPSEAIASMNMFGLTPATFEAFEKDLVTFLTHSGNSLTREFYLPSVMNNLIKGQHCNIHVLPTKSRWFGMTYKEDAKTVKSAIDTLTAAGTYPSKLWQR